MNGYKTLSRYIVGGLLALLVCGVAYAQQPTEKLPDGAQLVAIEAFPAEIQLKHRFDYAQLLLTGRLENGQQVDVTRLVEMQAGDLPVDVSPAGMVRPLADGQSPLVFTLGSQSVTVPVTVTGVEQSYEADFIRDVKPAMSKLGCNAGTCHGAKEGKNGFKLSLRGYDAQLDHRALTDDLAGRRFNRSAPDNSLMLLKPSGGVPHVGGVVTRPGERFYQLLRSWIAAGVKFNRETPRVAAVEVFPKNPELPLPGMKQQLRVLATYSDGTQRDVTAEAIIQSSLTEVFTVDSQGLTTAVRRGEAATLVRYEGAYAATTIVVMGDRSGYQWQAVATHNHIDELVYGKLRKVKNLPSDLCTDAEFLRRVYLDLTGLPPSVDEVRQFLADERETRVKREEVIDRLIGSPRYVDFWTNKWADLLQVNRKFLGEKGAWAMRRWIQQAIATNQPYDQFAHHVLTASGSTLENPPASYYKVLREPGDIVENTTQLFLAIRFNCNKCHDHPFERWTQDQYYDLAAYFAQVGRKDAPEYADKKLGGTAVERPLAAVEVIFDSGSGEVTHERTGQTAAPAFPFLHKDLAHSSASRREQLARWVTSPENQYFAKSYVNRIWSYLLGVGIIDPVDDIRAGNPPTNPELLERLTEDFIASGFDVQRLIRTICRSRVYQHSVATNRWNEDDEINFSHALARRLPAETLYNAVYHACGTVIRLPGVPEGFTANQLPDASVKLTDGFLDLFGRPARESACECERSGGVMLGQMLNLVNGPTIAEAIAAEGNGISRIVAQHEDDAQVVEELFLAILNRPPTAAETALGVESLRSDQQSRLLGAQDLAWALLNSPAFLFNR